MTMVQLLDWSYRIQRVDQAENLGLCRQERWERGLAGGGSALAAGPRVDGGVGGLAPVHRDAETVHRAVMDLPFLTRGLILQYGRTGEVPDWVPGAELVERYARNEKGQPIRLYDFNRRFIGYRRETVVLVGGVETGLCGEGLRLARDVWALWADGVWQLCRTVGPLVRHQVDGPGVLLRPWDGGDALAA